MSSEINNQSLLFEGTVKSLGGEYFYGFYANWKIFVATEDLTVPHFIKAAPEKDLLKKWQNKEIGWEEYDKKIQYSWEKKNCKLFWLYNVWRFHIRGT